jgi:hypothetical protein
VDELELDPVELRTLRAGLQLRDEGVIDLEGASPEERASLVALKRRMRGETETLSMTEADAVVRDTLQERRQRARRRAGFTAAR